MPNRLIRESLIDSERYAQCSTEAKLFFVHLMLVADDFGCVQVSPTFLRRRCFHDAPTNESIARLLNELQDVDLIRLYDVDRQALAFIPRFGQRLQRSTLKHPAPQESLYSDDKDACTKFNEINNKTKNPTVVQQIPKVPQPPEVEVEVEVEVKNKTPLSELPKKRAIADASRRVLEFLNQTAGKRFRDSPANLKLIEARLVDGITEDQLRKVVVKKSREWLPDPEMSQYIQPKTLFNRTNCENYVGNLVPLSEVKHEL